MLTHPNDIYPFNVFSTNDGKRDACNEDIEKSLLASYTSLRWSVYSYVYTQAVGYILSVRSVFFQVCASTTIHLPSPTNPLCQGVLVPLEVKGVFSIENHQERAYSNLLMALFRNDSLLQTHAHVSIESRVIYDQTYQWHHAQLSVSNPAVKFVVVFWNNGPRGGKNRGQSKLVLDFDKLKS